MLDIFCTFVIHLIVCIIDQEWGLVKGESRRVCQYGKNVYKIYIFKKEVSVKHMDKEKEI